MSQLQTALDIKVRATDEASDTFNRIKANAASVASGGDKTASAIQSARIGLLQQEARLGDEQAARDLKLLALSAQHTRERQAILKLLEQENITAEQRLELQRMLAQQTSIEMRERERITGISRGQLDADNLAGLEKLAAQGKIGRQRLEDASLLDRDGGMLGEALQQQQLARRRALADFVRNMRGGEEAESDGASGEGDGGGFDANYRSVNRALRAARRIGAIMGGLQILGQGMELFNAKNAAEALAIVEKMPFGIGQAAAGGAALREAFTHEKEELQKVNEEIESGNRLYDARLSFMEKVRAQVRETAREAAATEARLGRSGIVGADKDLAEIEAKKQAELAKLDPEIVKAEQNKVRAERQKDIEKQKELLLKLGGGEGGAVADLVRARDSSPEIAKSQISQPEIDYIEARKKLRQLEEEQGREVDNVQTEAATKRVNIEKDAQASVAEVRARAARENRDFLARSRIQEATTASEAEARRLQASGRILEAHQVQLQGQARARQREIDEEERVRLRTVATDDTKARADIAAAYDQQRNAVAQKLNADLLEASKRDTREVADHKAGIDRDLADSRIAQMRAEAIHGNTMMALDVRRAEIAEEYRGKREALLKILRDEQASEAQKAEAQRQLGGLSDSEAKARKKAALEIIGDAPGLASAVTGGAISGIAARSSEQIQQAEQLEALEAIGAATKENQATLTEILKELRSGQRVVPGTRRA